MIRVVMFDLGMTLIDADQRPFAHVPEALDAVAGFLTADSRPLLSCLVSDYTMVTPPITAAKVRPLFDEYLAILDASGLRPYFEPVRRRVTLSTHVGVRKPERALFEQALRRLHSQAGLEECLLVTENADHIRAARETLGMAALQFKAPGASQFDFDDWSQAPALIAQLVDPQQPANLKGAVQAYLAARGVEAVSADAAGTPGKINVAGQVWRAMPVPGHPELGDVHVAVPVEGELARGRKGELGGNLPGKPSAEQLAEARSFIGSLAAHGQIAGTASGPGRGATHAIETDAQGRRRLVRKRFSAI
jgi:hypothetical protein